MLDSEKYIKADDEILNKNWCGTVDSMLAL